MRLTIAERLRPFSHLPGTSFVLPGSSLVLEIYPTMIRVDDISGPLPKNLGNISFDFEGPILNFTAIQDLVNGSLSVFGDSAEGYFRYAIHSLANGTGICISLEKALRTINIRCSEPWKISKDTLEKGEKLILGESIQTHGAMSSFTSTERLSLGSHKLQDWELVNRRLSFIEIFPIWHRLGQMVTKPLSDKLAGTSFLLKDCNDAILANAPDKILPHFKNIYLAGFDGVLSPRLSDTDHNGIRYPETDPSNVNEASPLSILTEGARLIRSLFLQEIGNEVHVLPAIPPEFHCGRFLDVSCGKQGSLSIEWTKKSLRCMTFKAKEDQQIAFSFSNDEKKCRLKTSNKDKGIVYIPGNKLDVLAGQDYWFDNFER